VIPYTDLLRTLLINSMPAVIIAPLVAPAKLERTSIFAKERREIGGLENLIT
jgi:hypothetical protein